MKSTANFAGGAVENCATIAENQQVASPHLSVSAIDSARELSERPAPFPYVFRWDRQGRKGQLCRRITRGKLNSILVEFFDGYRMVTSGNAIRRATK